VEYVHKAASGRSGAQGRWARGGGGGDRVGEPDLELTGGCETAWRPGDSDGQQWPKVLIRGGAANSDETRVGGERLRWSEARPGCHFIGPGQWETDGPREAVRQPANAPSRLCEWGGEVTGRRFGEEKRRGGTGNSSSLARRRWPEPCARWRWRKTVWPKEEEGCNTLVPL
jgi:hypothetical protein